MKWFEFVDDDTKVFVSDGETTKEIIGFKYDTGKNQLTVFLQEPISEPK